VTFLFTDIEGSTRLWQEDEEAMGLAVARHDELLRRVVAAHGGEVFSTMGDGMAVAFSAASSAVAAALDIQRALEGQVWPTVRPLRVRMALHTGEAEPRDADYFGPAVNRTARLMAVGHGGQVLCSQATAALVEGEAALVDLGEHRLRDLDRPMHVFQVGDGAFAALRSLDVLPGNLPSLASSFVGRREELGAVARELGADRLVTLTGVGGVGKTRLALQVAADLLPGFADGAWVCELAAAANGDDMAQVVASALGVVQRPQMTLGESIVDFLRARRMLVVLDNCEHLLDEAAVLVEMILAAAPGVRVLATSREGLGLPGERVWPLRSLGLPTTLDAAGSSDAVVLFAERARAVVPDFVLDGATVPAVVEVCRRLDGIPLAIELAAARVVTMTPADVVGHLDERFRLLTGGRRGRVERHQTLRAAVEWSYSLLSDTERTVFDRLGVFPASFDESAAVAVCATDGIERWDVIDGLASLAAKSMVGTERAGGTARYQLLETLRHFARDRAGAAGDLDRLRRRHAQFFAGFAERAGAGAMSADELVWWPRLALEMDNLRAATGWALDSVDVDDVALGARILAGLAGVAFYRQSSGILAWATARLARADELDAARRRIVLGLAAYDALNLGQPEQATVLGGRVLAEPDASTTELLGATCAVSISKWAGGDPAGAMAVLTDGRSRLEAAGVNDWTKVYLSALTNFVASATGDHDTARSEAERTLAGARWIGAPTLLASALSVYAWAVCDDNPDEALAAAEESVRLTDAGAGDVGYTGALSVEATIRADRGDHVGASRAMRAAVTHNAKTGLRNMMSFSVQVAALVLADLPDTVEAASTLAGVLTGPELGIFPLFLSPQRRDRYQQRLADLDDQLLADTQQRGAAMTYDLIVAFTLEQLDRLAHR